jgi:hypothetical protein
VCIDGAPDGTGWDVDHTFGPYDEEFGFGMWMCLEDGSLFGNGKDSSDTAGWISARQIVTMELDTDAHTLKFWVDGKPHGPGFTSRMVVGSLCWALNMGSVFHAVHLAPSEDVVLKAPGDRISESIRKLMPLG